MKKNASPTTKPQVAEVISASRENTDLLDLDIHINEQENGMLVVGISIEAESTSAMNIKSVKAGLADFIYVSDSSVIIDDGGSFYRTVLYYLPDPPTGEVNISIRTVGTCREITLGSISLCNTYQGAPVEVATNSFNDRREDRIDTNMQTYSENATIISVVCSSADKGVTFQSENAGDDVDNISGMSRSGFGIDRVSNTGMQTISYKVSTKSLMGVSCAAFSPYSTEKKISIAYDVSSEQQRIGILQLEKALLRTSYLPVLLDLKDCQGNEKISVRVSPSSNLQRGGFEILSQNDSYTVAAVCDAGAMYGLFELAEKIQKNGFDYVESQKVNPRFPLRAIKHNTPWSSYRNCLSIDQHINTMKDVFYWESFLNMMAENRYNTLSIFSLHPFPYMIRPKSFPKAMPFTDRELSEWKFLYSSIFRMARQRNIDTYLVTWNIFVSDSFKFHYDKNALTDTMGYKNHNSYNSVQIEKYTRECVTQVFDEYPDLTGIGISLGENMGGMNARERDEWAQRTIITGAQAAERPVKLIYRAPFSAGLDSDGSTSNDVELLTRKSIESIEDVSLPIETEIKFNWSHGYANDRLIHTHGGGITDTYWSPPPSKHRIGWMIRNEDFFMLRWGQPDFVRNHIENNGQDYVGGYYIGSEGYYPALNYIDIESQSENKNRFGFKRQWLLYMIWGRLLYDVNTPDSIFEYAFDMRYGNGIGRKLLNAFKFAGNFPTLFGSFIYSTWDFTAYAEGFLCPVMALFNDNNVTENYPFLTITDLMEYKVLDPDFLSINDYVKLKESPDSIDGRTTPLDLADILERNSAKSFALIDDVNSQHPGLGDEIGDIKAWCYLSRYFANKLRAAVALKSAQILHSEESRRISICYINTAKKDWEELIAATKDRYKQVRLIHTSELFSWEKYLVDVEKDIEIVSKMKIEEGGE